MKALEAAKTAVIVVLFLSALCFAVPLAVNVYLMCKLRKLNAGD